MTEKENKSVSMLSTDIHLRKSLLNPHHDLRIEFRFDFLGWIPYRGGPPLLTTIRTVSLPSPIQRSAYVTGVPDSLARLSPRPLG